MTDVVVPDPPEVSLTLAQVRDHARRYMEAVHGKSVWFAAPETFGNVLERWIWGVACGSEFWTKDSIETIERLAAQHKEERTQ